MGSAQRLVVGRVWLGPGLTLAVWTLAGYSARLRRACSGFDHGLVSSRWVSVQSASVLVPGPCLSGTDPGPFETGPAAASAPQRRGGRGAVVPRHARRSCAQLSWAWAVPAQLDTASASRTSSTTGICVVRTRKAAAQSTRILQGPGSERARVGGIAAATCPHAVTRPSASAPGRRVINRLTAHAQPGVTVDRIRASRHGGRGAREARAVWRRRRRQGGHGHGGTTGSGRRRGPRRDQCATETNGVNVSMHYTMTPGVSP